MRLRRIVWPFLVGLAATALVAYELRDQRAELPPPAPSSEAATRRSAVDDEVGGLELEFTGWTPLFRGIDHGAGKSVNASAGVLRVNALRLRLDEPGLALFGTPSNGAEPEETTGESATDFLERNGLSVAVNTHFFRPCCDATPEPKDLVGLAISNGELVSPPGQANGAGSCVLVVDASGVARVLDAPAPDDLGAIDFAAAGSDVLVMDGALVCRPNGEGFLGAHPRTAAGVSADGRTLYLVTIDGRQVGWSNGATLRETAAWLRFLGADDALNLDGGGSTTMVRSVDGKAVLLNRPVGLRIPGTLRWNGSHLGAVAAPLAGDSGER